MDQLFECYFTQVFADMSKGDLLARYKRREVIDYFHNIITGCVQAGCCTASVGYTLAVNACLRHHAESKAANGGVCLRGKHHSLLYVAAKLAFDGQIEGEALTEILNDIVGCEGSFEKLFVGAIFGTKAASLMIGWKSDFDSREESVKALEYYVHHSTVSRLDFLGKGGRRDRLVDYPMESYGLSTPLRSTIMLNKHDVLLILLRHGAVLDVDEDGHVTSIDFIVEGLFESFGDRDYRPMMVFKDTIACLKLMFAAIPQAKLKLRDVVDEAMFRKLLAAYPFLPARRCGLAPPELKHLARCKVREALNKNWKLPMGIDELNVPETVKEYLDLGDG